MFGGIEKYAYLCIAIKENGSVAQLNRASDYGSEGYRFESCRSHRKKFHTHGTSFCVVYPHSQARLNQLLNLGHLMVLQKFS